MPVCYTMPQQSRPNSGPESAPAFEAPHPGVRHPRDRPRGLWSPFTNGVIIAVLAILVFSAIFAAATSPQVGPVHAWRPADEPGDLFTVQVPVGWQVIEQTEDDGVRTIVVRRSRWVHAIIRVYPKLAGEVAIWGAATGGSPTDLLGVIHRLGGRMFNEQLGGIEEGPTAPTDLGGARALWCRLQFHGAEDIYGDEQMAGIRATLAHGPAAVLMVAVAPEASWPEFEPIALQIFRSISFDSGGPPPPG